jgi:glyoxylase-like metal-dependent hydrolase (beta-lactamase superfamily II)
MGADILDLCDDGRLVGLPCPYRLDGRVTTHADDARGFAPMNTYVLVERDAALVLEAGLSVHEASLLGRLDLVLGGRSELALFPLSLAEFRSVCNARAIIDRFGVRTLYGLRPDAASWIDFRGTTAADTAHPVVRTVGTEEGEHVALGGRRVRTLPAVLHAPTTLWLYDDATRTLFTSDAFTHVRRGSEEGPWVVDEDGDATTLRDVTDHLARGPFWWLRGAQVGELRRALAAVFERFDVELVAPSYGCVLRGREVVRRHHALLQQALRRLGAR